MLRQVEECVSKPYGGYPYRTGEHASVGTTGPSSTILLSLALTIAKERWIVLDVGSFPTNGSWR